MLMIKNCEKCGAKFEGRRDAHYCKPCRIELQRNASRNYQAKMRKLYPELVREKMRRYKATGTTRSELPKPETAGRTIEYIRKGDLWTWCARKGNAEIKAGRYFETLRIAQKDCLLALG